ncbi:MAG: iron ABC transporter permease, partial [Planctomycetaceae bacterium]|nr:iron ABC transporter permease [Planctomycetaceae bacterium]
MKTKIIATTCISTFVLVFCMTLGSVSIPLADLFGVIGHKVFGFELPEHIKSSSLSIVWEVRLPRVLLAFTAGAAISVSGAAMQSVMRNPLASPYTLGVSSGASFGACLVIFYGAILPVAANVALPVMGFLFGLGTIVLAVGMAQKLDRQMQNFTIILVGMVFSLFINAITTLMSALAQDHIQKLIFWQMGSFNMKGWPPVFLLVPIAVMGTLLMTHYNRELDMMTFGEDQARSMGVNLKAVKWTLLMASAALTGCVIAFCGIIGFVDLVIPHIVRKIFGASHRVV